MGRSIFFEKNLRTQFDVVFDSESNGGIFDSLTPLSGELWRFENLKFVQHLRKKFFEDFFVAIGKVKNSTQSKKSTFPLCFHFTNTDFRKARLFVVIPATLMFLVNKTYDTITKRYLALENYKLFI